MNKDELAQWLVNYLHSNFQIRDAWGHRLAGLGPLQMSTNWDGMATALLEAMKPTSEDLGRRAKHIPTVPALAAWLEVYLSDLRKPPGGFENMAESLLAEMLHASAVCWCNCHDETPMPAAAESIPLKPAADYHMPDVVIHEKCPACQGQRGSSICDTCSGAGAIERAMPLDQLMGIYFAEVNKEVEARIESGDL